MSPLERGAVQDGYYHNRIGYREERFSGPRGGCRGRGRHPPAAETQPGDPVLREAGGLSHWHRSLSDVASLVTRAAGVGPRGAVDAAQLREAVREAGQERCGRCGGDLRGGDAADDALRADQDPGAAGRPDAAPDPGVAGAPAHHAGQCHPRAYGRVRDRGACWPAPDQGASGGDCRPGGSTPPTLGAGLPGRSGCPADVIGAGDPRRGTAHPCLASLEPDEPTLGEHPRRRADHGERAGGLDPRSYDLQVRA